jgi:hypothetical protein
MKETDANDFIFQQKVSESVDQLDEFYSMTGEQDYYDNNNNPRLVKDGPKTLAKKLFTEKSRPRHLILMNTDGKLHNPLNITSKQKMTSNFLDRKCREPKFKPVSEKTFSMYVNFLKSKNLSWLYNADREAE